jgi:hypothetical protein
MSLLKGRTETISTEFTSHWLTGCCKHVGVGVCDNGEEAGSSFCSPGLGGQLNTGGVCGGDINGVHLTGSRGASDGWVETMTGEFKSQNISINLWTYHIRPKIETGGSTDGADGGVG